jgi:hypothetical protein
VRSWARSSTQLAANSDRAIVATSIMVRLIISATSLQEGGVISPA